MTLELKECAIATSVISDQELGSYSSSVIGVFIIFVY